MKKRIIALALSLMASNAYAVPTGCFYTDNSSYCYSGQFLASDCDQWNMTSYYFGNYVSSMCSYINATESTLYVRTVALDSCNADFNTAVAQRNALSADKAACLTTAASIESNRQQWIAYAGKRDALITKLYRACGSKCRRIR
jgi:hypothetical protein